MTQKDRKHIDHAENITIVGGSFLAFELAASLDHPDRTIRIVARGNRFLPQVSVKTADRLLGSTTAFTQVDVESTAMRNKSLTTNHGPVPADLVIAAGAVPNTEIAVNAVSGRNGIATDVYADTASKGVSNWRSESASPATFGPIRARRIDI